MRPLSPVFVKVSMTGMRCRGDIMITYVRLYRDGLDFSLTDYNAHPDKYRLVHEYL